MSLQAWLGVEDWNQLLCSARLRLQDTIPANAEQKTPVREIPNGCRGGERRGRGANLIFVIHYSIDDQRKVLKCR